MDAIYAPDVGSDRMTIYARFGGFVAGVEQFDAAAFRLPVAEAVAVDPQVRWVRNGCRKFDGLVPRIHSHTCRCCVSGC